MADSTRSDKVQYRRYDIDCPVSVTVRGRMNGGAVAEGRLRDIGTEGARFYLALSLPVGTRLNLQVQFQNPREKPTIIAFDAIVTDAREKPPYEIAVRFQGKGKFLRDALGQVLGRARTHLHSRSR